MCICERGNSVELFDSMSACRNQCIDILTQVMGQFTGEISLLKNRMHSLVNGIRELENDKIVLTKSYRNILSDATVDVGKIDKVMTQAERKIVFLDQTLKHSNRLFDDLVKENKEFSIKITEMNSKIDSLNNKVISLEEQNCVSDYSNDEYRMLLEMALHKLQILENSMSDKKGKKRYMKLGGVKPDTKFDSLLDHLIGRKKGCSDGARIPVDQVPDCQSQISFEIAISDSSASTTSDISRVLFENSKHTINYNNDYGSEGDKKEDQIFSAVSYNYLQHHNSSNHLENIEKIFSTHKSYSGLNVNSEYQTAIDKRYSKIPKKASFLERKITVPILKRRVFGDSARGDPDKLPVQSQTIPRNFDESETNPKQSSTSRVKRHLSFGAPGLRIFSREKRSKTKKRRSKTLTGSLFPISDSNDSLIKMGGPVEENSKPNERNE